MAGTGWSVCEMASWYAPAAAFFARPADEGVPTAYVKEAECSEGRRWRAGHGKLSSGRPLGECRKTGNWLARHPLTWHFVINRRANGGFLSTLLASGGAETSRAAVGDIEMLDQVDIDHGNGHDHELGDPISPSDLEPLVPVIHQQYPDLSPIAGVD